MTPVALWVRLAALGGSAAASLLIDVPSPAERVDLPSATVVGIGAGILLYVALSSVYETNTRTSTASRTQIGFLCVWALVEELIWRRFVFGGLTAVAGVPAAFGLSTLGFAALHRFGRGAHVVTGSGFCLAYVLTGQLFAAVAAHVAYNLLVADAPRRYLARAEAA